MNKNADSCYFCGGDATTDEHVPPKSFFPEGKRKNLITVPSCEMHNNQYSRMDEYFRALFQLTADSPHVLDYFKSKTLKGLKRKDRPGLLRSLMRDSIPAKLNDEATIAIKVQHQDIQDFFEKVVKALFYHHNGRVYQGNVSVACSHLLHDGQDFAGLIDLFLKIESKLISIETGQPEIFRYKLASVIEPSALGFAIWITLYDSITVFGLGVDTH